MAGNGAGALELAVVVRAAQLLERGCERVVELGPLAGQQVVVERLAQQRVAEHEAVVLPGHEHLLGDCLAQRAGESIALDPGHPRDRLVVKPAAGRDGARDQASIVRQALDPQQERVAEARGAAPRPSSPAASSSSV